MNLLEKRAALIAEHQAMEKYEPHWKALAEKGDQLSERPIAFLCDDEVVVVGDCVEKILDGLLAFMERADDYQDRAKREPAVAQALAKCGRAVGAAVPEEIRVGQQIWNAYLFGLNEVGVKVVLTDGSK